MFCATSLRRLTVSTAVSSAVFISGLSVIPTIEILLPLVWINEALCESMASENMVKLL